MAVHHLAGTLGSERPKSTCGAFLSLKQPVRDRRQAPVPPREDSQEAQVNISPPRGYDLQDPDRVPIPPQRGTSSYRLAAQGAAGQRASRASSPSALLLRHSHSREASEVRL